MSLFPQEHEMTHSGEKPFACKLCNFSARRNKQLQLHMEDKHPHSAALLQADQTLAPTDKSMAGTYSSIQDAPNIIHQNINDNNNTNSAVNNDNKNLDSNFVPSTSSNVNAQMSPVVVHPSHSASIQSTQSNHLPPGHIASATSYAVANGFINDLAMPLMPHHLPVTEMVPVTFMYKNVTQDFGAFQ